MKIAPALLATCLLTAACLENEEDIKIRPDGSVRVTLKSTGDVQDLTRGYALPLHAPWQPVTPTTRTWIETFGGATGGAAVRARHDAGAWHEMDDPDEPGVELVVAAEFPSVADLPTILAPDATPYRSALLERQSTLTITNKGTRQVYVFERTYATRPFWNRFDESQVPAEIVSALEERRHLTDEQAHQFTASLREWAHSAPSMHVITSALGAVYTDGEGELSSVAFGRAVQGLHEAIDTILVADTITGLFDALNSAKDTGAALPPEFDLEQLLRSAARSVIATTLREDGIDREVRLAVLARLEWNFTSYDLAQDIADEQFKLNVTMPGMIVDGNFDAQEGSTVSWSFEGSVLHGARRVLRVVSVLD